MDDPKRLRTKIRLDLSDVKNQIEDYEDILKKDKSTENVEALEKLVAYQAKLEEQYEAITGISVDQATKLVVRPKGEKKSSFPNVLGILAGIFFGWGFYNVVLHGVVGFGPMDLINFFAGTNDASETALSIISGLKYSEGLASSNQLIIVPLGISAFFFFLRGILSKSRTRFVEFIDSLSLVMIAGFFVYLIELSSDNQKVLDGFVDNFMYLGLAILVAGLLTFMSAFAAKGAFKKLIKLLVGILVIYAAIQILMISIVGESKIPGKMTTSWAWFIAPLFIAGFFTAFYDFLEFRSIRKDNKVFG